MNKAQLARWTTLTGYYGLLVLLLNWYTWLSPPTALPRSMVLIILLVPLLFPMRGLLHAKIYTHAWTSFLSLPYFALGIDTAVSNPADRHLGLLQIVFSVLLFFGCVFYPRYARRQRESEQQ